MLNSGRTQPPSTPARRIMTEADFARLELQYSQLFDSSMQPPKYPPQQPANTEADFARLEHRNSQMFNSSRTQPPSTPRRIMTEADFARLELQYSQLFDSSMQPPRHPPQQPTTTASRRSRPPRDDGLSAQVISKYLKIRNADDKDGDRKICAVCLDDVSGLKDTVATLDDCGHEFHSCCLKRWLQRKNTCPLCKRIALNF